jgi:hypothetical protein
MRHSAHSVVVFNVQQTVAKGRGGAGEKEGREATSADWRRGREMARPAPEALGR